MKSSSLFVLCLFVACVGLVAAFAENSREMDYMLYVARWGTTACETDSKKCTIPRNVHDFTMHGLWANYNDTTGPSFCDENDPFKEDEVKDLESDLREYWTDYFTLYSMGFYQHEWEKHGTCSKSVPELKDQHGFFSTVMSINKNLAIVDKLAQAGIKPGTNEFQMSDLENPLRDAYGVTPLLYCKRSHKEGNLLLHIRFCIDKNLNLFECNDAEKQMVKDKGPCGDGFYWQPLANTTSIYP